MRAPLVNEHASRVCHTHACIPQTCRCDRATYEYCDERHILPYRKPSIKYEPPWIWGRLYIGTKYKLDKTK